MVEEYGENLQRLIQECDKDVPSYIDYIPWQCRQNQKIVKARLEAKKIKRRGKPHVLNFPPLVQLRWFHGYEAPMLEVSTNAIRTPRLQLHIYP